jgi:hypothetical protein
MLKSFRPTREDAIAIQKIMDGDPRIEKPSEALYYAYKDAAEKIPDWPAIKKLKFDNEDNDIEVDEQAYGGTMSFTVDENDFETVVNSLKQQLRIERVRISYMTRLCILAAARTRLGSVEEKKEHVVEVQNIDGVDLLRKVNEKAAQLILADKTDKIMEFLKED